MALSPIAASRPIDYDDLYRAASSSTPPLPARGLRKERERRNRRMPSREAVVNDNRRFRSGGRR
jgi:hypothetical protein